MKHVTNGTPCAMSLISSRWMLHFLFIYWWVGPPYRQKQLKFFFIWLSRAHQKISYQKIKNYFSISEIPSHKEWTQYPIATCCYPIKDSAAGHCCRSLKTLLAKGTKPQSQHNISFPLLHFDGHVQLSLYLFFRANCCLLFCHSNNWLVMVIHPLIFWMDSDMTHKHIVMMRFIITICHHPGFGIYVETVKLNGIHRFPKIHFD